MNIKVGDRVIVKVEVGIGPTQSKVITDIQIEENKHQRDGISVDSADTTKGKFILRFADNTWAYSKQLIKS